MNRIRPLSFLFCFLIGGVMCLDFTDKVFEGKPLGLLAAFGDFNSDKLTDVFVIDNHQQSFGILLAYTESPFLRREHLDCSLRDEMIDGLVPGDFDGDGAMDILILSQPKGVKETFNIHIAWGALTKLDCPNQDKPLLQTLGHPLVLDYNSDMISDLFALDSNGIRQFWIFNSSRQIDHLVKMNANNTLRIPHSHAFVDLDGDMSTDLLLTGQDSFELWHFNGTLGLQIAETIELPVKGAVIGQSVFVDVNFDGKLDHLLPVCVDSKCLNSSFYIYSDDEWHPIQCDLKDPSGKVWTFQPPDPSQFYQETLTARSGDFNLDGYPDLLVTLTHADQVRAVLLENVVNEFAGRQFNPRWDLLTEWNTTSIMGAMYDIQEKGVLDVLLVHRPPSGELQMAAYKNTLDYDANFIKVLVLTGRCYANCSNGRIPYGTNLPGPSISYRTTQPDGALQLACSAQLSQSAYSALQLPYSLFGLARSPNFLETLKEILAAVNRRDAFKFDHRIIPTPTEINLVQNAGTNRAAINRDIKFQEIYDVFLDRTISTSRVTDEPLGTAFRQVAWSPSGLIPYRNVKCWSLSWSEGSAPTCTLLGAIIPDEDSIPVTAMEIISANGYLIVTVTKNNALVASTIKCDGNGLHCIDLQFALLPGLQLSGLSKLAGGNVVCVTEDYLVNEIDLTFNNEGVFNGLKAKKLGVSTNPHMLCRGITTVWGGDSTTLIAIESVKVSYDHLKCRQPTTLIVYVNGDMQRVTNVLESALNMGSSWFALFKCNACFIERRYDKEVQDDLKMRAEKAEFCLQLRHITRIFTELLSRPDNKLTPDEFMNLSLAYKFVCTPTVTDSEVKFDQTLTEKIQEKFKLKGNMPEEVCPICQKDILFESREEGQCSSEHRALRCRATLRTCYEHTFSCRWCGTHYHLDSGLDACILCGGPLLILT
nr:EOG090X03KG [Ceriodaphnia reticulata]